MTHRGEIPASNGYLRPMLWLALAIGAVGNVVFSTTGISLVGNLAFSVVTIAAIIALVVHHYRNRRS